MSMSDNADRAGAQQTQQGTGLKNPYASTGTDQSGGKPATGLPGLAAFGQMQGYTAQTPQPTQAPPAQQSVPAESAPEPAPRTDYAPYADQPAEQLQQPVEQDFPYEQEQPFPQEESRTAPYTETAHAEYGAGADAQAFAGNGHGQSMNLADLAEAYRNEVEQQPAQESHYEFSAEELQSYMAGQADGEPEAERGEAFDLSQHMAVQPFEARYDQREVNLGAYDEPAEQPFFHHEQEGDADFIGGDDADEQMPPPKERKSRRALMFASGLIGALALGGALAFAYKTTGDTQLADGSGPPLIKADDRPVKVAPEEPGGKQFAHQNKQIYDRLQGGQKPEVERLVPRQETVADAPPPGAAIAPSATSAPGTPHKVRTLKVMPDGSVVVSAPPEENAQPPEAAPPAQAATQMQSAQYAPSAPAVPSLPAPGSEAAGVAVTMPPAQADQTTVASVPEAQQPNVAAQPAQQPRQMSSDATPAPMPQQRPAAPARQTASASPAQTPRTAATNSGFAVQVASRRSQAMALAAFADLQQKYTSLLGDYQPLIQSADLGDKGVWYRLRVGPIGQKAAADDLCSNLKRAGLRSCLVRPL